MTTLSPDAIPSTAVVHAPTVRLAVYPDAIASTAAVPTAQIGQPLVVGNIASTAVVQTLIQLQQRLYPDCAVAPRAVYDPLVYRPADLRISPSTGSFRGGAGIALYGGQLDISDAQDDFSSGLLAPRWTDVSTGSGTVVEQATARVLAFDTGTTPGSTARVRSTTNTLLDVDVSCTFRRTLDQRVRGLGKNVYGVLGLTTGTTKMELALVAEGRERFVILRMASSGVAEPEILLIPDTDPPTALPRTTLRILRGQGQIVVFVGDAPVLRFESPNVAMAIEIGIENDATLATRTQAVVSEYLRRPVVVLGTEPIEDLRLVGRSQAYGTVPALNIPDDVAVDVLVTAVTGAPATLTAGFTYTIDIDLYRFRDAGASLIVLNDPQMRR